MLESFIKSDILQSLPEAQLYFDEPMSAHTSLHIGGPADVFILPPNGGALANTIAVLDDMGLPCTVIGGGTNILVLDGGIRGAVVGTRLVNGLSVVEADSHSTLLEVECGHSLQMLLGYMRKNGLKGLEGLAGIPGCIGGAIKGNAGSYGSEIMAAVEYIDIIESGSRRRLSKRDISYGYRRTALPDGAIILSAGIRAEAGSPEEVGSLMDEYLKHKSASQPIGQHSAGCVFKNPPSAEPAARLIDAAGLKGASEGDVMVSPVHAGFFVSSRGAKAADFLRLMRRVSETVYEKFGVALEPEIRQVGE